MQWKKQNNSNILHLVKFSINTYMSLDMNENKEGLLKRLKNIEGKNEQRLDLIKTQREKQLNLINKNNLENRSEKLEIK